MSSTRLALWFALMAMLVLTTVGCPPEPSLGVVTPAPDTLTPPTPDIVRSDIRPQDVASEEVAVQECPASCSLYETCGEATRYECAAIEKACEIDPEDALAWCSWSPDKAAVYDVCREGFPSPADREGLVNCIFSAGGFGTRPCASCMAGLTLCVYVSCGFDCLLADTIDPAACRSCVTDNCAQSEACAGTPDCTCVAQCDGKTCGDDGCGGSCGTCDDGPNDTCNPDTGLCQCQPDCTGKQCGDDGCGGECGPCAAGATCEEGSCLCAPQCDNKVCGDDGCGATCGECPEGQECATDQASCICEPDCSGKICGPDGCGGVCGVCQAASDTCVAGACVNGGTCATPVSVDAVLPTVIVGDTLAVATNSAQYNTSWCDQGDDSNIDAIKGASSYDVVHAFVAPTSTAYQVTMTPVNPSDPDDKFPGILYVVGDCADVENTCIKTANEESFGIGAVKTLTFQGVANLTYYIIVDGRDYIYENGVYSLEVDYAPEP